MKIGSKVWLLGLISLSVSIVLGIGCVEDSGLNVGDFAQVESAGDLRPDADVPVGDKRLQAEIDNQLKQFPGGQQISSHEVSYNEGNVIVVFPDATGYVPVMPIANTESGNAAGVMTATAITNTKYWHGCPYGNTTHWYCFYDSAGFAGRMIKFKDCSKKGYENNFELYGFAYKASSWVNTSKNFIQVYTSFGTEGNDWLWSERAEEAGNTPTGTSNKATDSVCYTQ